MKFAALVAAVYASLWGVTIVFGPAAIRTQEKKAHDESYTRNGLPPSSKLKFTSVFVPIPFIVDACWSTHEQQPDGAINLLSKDESRTVWVFGWTRVIYKRNLLRA